MKAFIPWLCLLILPTFAADWLTITTPEVTLLTDAGEKSARSTLARLAELRGIFAEGTRYARLHIFLFASPREFRA